MHWSEAAITWGREDHLPLIPSPGEYALVLDPIVCSDTHTSHFSHVLIDEGSNINLLYWSSMEKLGIPVAQLKPSRLTFHGIMRGHLCTPMGRVQLEVFFGEKGNSRHEPIWFEVVEISSPYHALLDRLALAKFVAVPHYTYLKMKLPGPHGVIIVSWFLRHVCHEGYLKAIERGDRRSGARDGDRQGLPRFTSPRWRIATSCYNSL
jgi:hypothetical protein